MRTASAISLVIFVSAAAPAPLKERPATPITAANIQQLREIGSIAHDVFELHWMPGSDNLAVSAWEDEIDVFDSRKKTSLRKLAVGKRLVKFAFSHGGKQLAWAENNSRVTIEDLKTGKGLTIETGNAQPSIDFSPDDKWLVTGSGGKAALWDLSNGKKVREFETDAEGGITPRFSPDGNILAVGNRNSDPRLFDVATGKLLHVLPKRMTQEIRFNRAGTILATTYVDGSLGLWDVASGKLLREAKSGGEELYSVDWSPKGDLLVTSGRNAKIIIWDAKELKPLKEFDAPEWVIRARFSPDGSRIVTAGGGTTKGPDRRITIWGLAGEN